MTPVYNTAISLYRRAVGLAGRFNTKAALMTRGQSETIGRLNAALAGRRGPVVWIHAASLGEFEQGRPLIERIRRDHPEWRVVLSFFSPSGYEVRKDYDLADAVVYLPFDTPRRVRAFLDAARPAVAIFVKYEFWGNYLTELRRREVPTYLISAIFRPSQPFFKRWGGDFRRMLGCFTRLFVQDEASRRLLEGIGVRDVTVAGDTRFDRVADVRSRRCAIAGIDRMMEGAGLRVVFGSSWPADEAVYMPWLNSRSDVKFIIAPHEFDAARLDKLRQSVGSRKVMLLSEWIKAGSPADTDGLIVDSFGHLSSLYRFADVAYIGGGFGAGIHNINEAAVYGVPVIFGPNHAKFREAAGLIGCGGGFAVGSAAELADVMERLSADPAALKAASEAAGAYISSNLGATDRVYDAIFKDNKLPHT